MEINPRTHKCKFCKKAFSSEKTLASHMCLKKKRWADKDTIGARLGFRVFQRFYEITTNSKKPKSQMDFLESKYYLAFVKFGRYLVELDPINPENFITFVIEHGVKLKDWTKAYVYDMYLEQLIGREPVEKALERTILTMEQWAKENNDTYDNFFMAVNTNEATFMIRNGKISPWVLYLSDSADKLLTRMNEEQGRIISEVIDSKKWHIKFMTRKEDLNFVKSILKEANV